MYSTIQGAVFSANKLMDERFLSGTTGEMVRRVEIYGGGKIFH
jgi:hypothetical protein